MRTFAADAGDLMKGTQSEKPSGPRPSSAVMDTKSQGASDRVGVRPLPAIAYLRVSTDEQADSGLGLEAQRAAVTAEAERRGWELEIVEDAGFTGRNMRRPGLDDVLTRLDNCQSETTLIVAKLDRLSRSVIDFAKIMERSHKNGWGLVCLDLNVDTTTPQGKMVARMFAVFAEFESELIGERTAAALARKKAQGVKLGRPRAVCDQATTHIANLRSFGCSYRRIAQFLNDEGVPTAQGGKWWAETVRQIDQRHECPTTAPTAETTTTPTNAGRNSRPASPTT